MMLAAIRRADQSCRRGHGIGGRPALPSRGTLVFSCSRLTPRRSENNMSAASCFGFPRCAGTYEAREPARRTAAIEGSISVGEVASP